MCVCVRANFFVNGQLGVDRLLSLAANLSLPPLHVCYRVGLGLYIACHHVHHKTCMRSEGVDEKNRGSIKSRVDIE